MKHIIEAVYRGGVLRPTSTLNLKEGETVRLAVLNDDPSSEQARALAGEVYNDLSRRDLAEIEQIALMSRNLADSGTIDRAE